MTHPLISNLTQVYFMETGIEMGGSARVEGLDAIRALCSDWILSRHPEDDHLHTATSRLLSYIERHWEEYKGDTQKRVKRRDNRSPLQKTTLTYLCALMDFGAAPDKVLFGESICSLWDISSSS